MIKLEFVEDIGSGTLSFITEYAAKKFGRPRTYDTTKEGIVVDFSGKEKFRGRTIMKSYSSGKTTLAFTKISDDPEVYIAYHFRELENTEWNNEY